jgi:lipopolysaccharide biosynthesis protein
MKIDVYDVSKKNKGWEICLRLELEEKKTELIKIQDISSFNDYQVFYKDDTIFFKVYMDLSEPWEDEPLEELLKAVKKELEYKLNLILD